MEETQVAKHRLSFLTRYMGLSDEESRSLVHILTQETPEEFVFERPIRGGKVARYIKWPYFVQRLNDAFGLLWSYEVPSVIEKDGHVVAQGRLKVEVPGRVVTREYEDDSGRTIRETVRLDGFSIVKEQFGSSLVQRWRSSGEGHKAGEVMDLGDAYKGASTDAIKKCATEFGMGLDVYGSREDGGGEMVMPNERQLESLFKRASQAGMKRDAATAWAEKETGKKLAELTQQDTLGLTARLIAMAKKPKEG